MSDRLKLIRVFIGSPGGLDEERQAAHDAVNSVNLSHSERWGIHFKLLGWESAVPGFIRPQSKINEDLDICEYFIGVLWNQWGSPPTTDPKGYTSGFEEEFYRAKNRIEKGLMKDMSIYFKDVNVPTGLKPDEQLQKVLDFKQKCIAEKEVFFKTFTDSHTFEKLVRSKLEKIGWDETELFNKDQKQDQSNRTPDTQDTSSESSSSEARLFDDDARTFLGGLIQRSRNWEGTSPSDVARLRLIGSAVVRSGNDDFYLGNHDANLIFQEYRNASLSNQEVSALADCGIVGFQHQNVPLWRWLAQLAEGKDIWKRVRFLAGVGNDAERKQALRILRLSPQPFSPIDEAVNKEKLLQWWLSDKTPIQVFESAVSYLASNADESDLPLIEETATAHSQNRQSKIEEAIVSILARTSLDAALQRVVDKEVDRVDTTLADSLFGTPQSLNTATAQLCVSAKSENIRLRAIKVLFARNELTLATAETLLTDSNHEIRLLAAETLKNHGHELSDEIARKALIKQTSGALIGLYGSTKDDTYYERYQLNRLAELDLPSLKAKVQTAGVFDEQELFVLYSKYTREMQYDIRENLRDFFKKHFERRLQERANLGIENGDLETQLREIETFRRQKYCTKALDALCSLKMPQDLNLVRKVIIDFGIGATENILTFLSRFGDWSDIKLVCKLEKTLNARMGLLSQPADELSDQKAAAILALGKNRVADMLALEIDGSIRISLARQLPKSIFTNLRNEILLRELERSEDEYRIIFALRCVQALPKFRISELLDRYVDSDKHRFYNSIHWLDLGAALPSPLAKIVASRALYQR